MGLWDWFNQVQEQNLVNKIADKSEDFIRRIRYEVWRYEKRMMKRVASFFIISLSAIAFILAGIFALVEYLELTATVAVLIVGILLLIIGLIWRI